MIWEEIGSDVTLVMHHPHFFSADYWTGWSHDTGCNIIAYDAPFHGGGEDCSFKDFAKRCVADARDRSTGHLVAVGVSQGGVIAQECGRLDEVDAVIGISTTRLEASPEERDAMGVLLKGWGEQGPGIAMARMIAQTSTNGEEPAYSRTVSAVLSMSAEKVSGSIPLLLSRRGMIPLEKPSLFIHGGADKTYPMDCCLIGDDLDIREIRGGSHSIAIQSRKEVSKHIRLFTQSLFPQLW